jgi:hypothetical protein
LVASPSGCREHLGYLSERSKGTEIPDECVACPKSLDCILFKAKTPDIEPVRHSQSHASLESLLVGKTVREQKALRVSQRRVNASLGSVADMIVWSVQRCARILFQTYCMVAVRTMSLYIITRSGLWLTLSLFKSYLTWLSLYFFKTFSSLNKGLLQSKVAITSRFVLLTKPVSLGRLGMSLSLTRRVKPRADMLQIEALGLTVKIARTQHSA